MRRVLIAITGLIAAAALGALAASLAGGDQPTELVIDPDREAGLVEVEPTATPSGAGSFTRGKREVRAGQLGYFQTPQPFEVLPQSEEAATLPCPGGYKAVGGFFVTGEAGTFLDLNAPQVAYEPEGTEPKPSKRNWVIGVYNSTAEPRQVRFGVVCFQKGK